MPQGDSEQVLELRKSLREERRKVDERDVEILRLRKELKKLKDQFARRGLNGH